MVLSLYLSLARRTGRRSLAKTCMMVRLRLIVIGCRYNDQCGRPQKVFLHQFAKHRVGGKAQRTGIARDFHEGRSTARALAAPRSFHKPLTPFGCRSVLTCLLRSQHLLTLVWCAPFHSLNKQAHATLREVMQNSTAGQVTSLVTFMGIPPS